MILQSEKRENRWDTSPGVFSQICLPNRLLNNLTDDVVITFVGRLFYRPRRQEIHSGKARETERPQLLGDQGNLIRMDVGGLK